MPDPARVVAADPADVDWIARLIADSCGEFDQAAWLVPNRRQRRTILGEVARIHVEHAMFHGVVHLLADRSGVAVWFDHHRALPAPPDYGRRLAEVAGSNTRRFVRLDTLLADHRPAAGYERLAVVAVVPGARGQGRGRALVTHHLARLDAAGIPTYAEVATTGGRDFHRRLGYRPTRLVRIPGGSAVCVMHRPAAPDNLEERQ